MTNFPLDANDEDILRRGLTRPSLGEDPLAINSVFQSVRSQYDNFTVGVTSIDNIWPQRTARELQNLTEEQRRQVLESRGVIPPAGSLPFGTEIPAVQQAIQNATPEIDLTAFGGAGAAIPTPTDSYGQSLQGATTQPRVITASGNTTPTPVGVQPSSVSSDSPYVYTPIDLYDDRYDFLTGKIIRKGIATGAKGGVGTEESSTVASPGLSNTQSETPTAPPALNNNDTSVETRRDQNDISLDAFGGAGADVSTPAAIPTDTTDDARAARLNASTDPRSTTYVNPNSADASDPRGPQQIPQRRAQVNEATSPNGTPLGISRAEYRSLSAREQAAVRRRTPGTRSNQRSIDRINRNRGNTGF
jgi:hypothetical protein